MCWSLDPFEDSDEECTKIRNSIRFNIVKKKKRKNKFNIPPINPLRGSQPNRKDTALMKLFLSLACFFHWQKINTTPTIKFSHLQEIVLLYFLLYRNLISVVQLILYHFVFLCSVLIVKDLLTKSYMLLNGNPNKQSKIGSLYLLWWWEIYFIIAIFKTVICHCTQAQTSFLKPQQKVDFRKARLN